MTAISYQVRLADLHAHLYLVTLTIARPQALQSVSLPVWIPGSYLVREFAKNLQRLQGRQGGRAVALTQLDKCRWQAQCAADQPLELSYEVYALDHSVRTAWLDTQRGFFNGTSLFLQVHGQEDRPHELVLMAPERLPAWQVATGLAPVKTSRKGFGRYRAANYDELVDCPVEMGEFWSGSFQAGGIVHRFVVAGAPPSFDGKRLLADTMLDNVALKDLLAKSSDARRYAGSCSSSPGLPRYERTAGVPCHRCRSQERALPFHPGR